MNGKKAKELRRQLKEMGAYKKEPDYKVVKHKKNVYVTDPVTGVPKLQSIEKIQLINQSRYTYRRAKKAYKNGEIVL